MHTVFSEFFLAYAPAIKAVMIQDFASFKRHSAKLFPTQAKCRFDKFGPSGSIVTYDGLCLLPQNTFNEKIFVFLYIWFVAMIAFQTINLLFQIVFMSCKGFRLIDLRRMSSGDSDLENFSDLGSWFFISLCYRNLAPILFRDLVNEIKRPRNV